MERIDRKLTEVLGEICSSSGAYFTEEFVNDHLKDTPLRMLKAWGEMLDGYKMDVDMKLSRVEDVGYSDWVGMTNIEFSSVCVHHFLPFIGSIDIMYVPNEHICGASKLARVAEMFSHRLQLQEYLAADIFEFLSIVLEPKKLGVRIVSKHCCVGCRGVKARNANFVTFKASDGYSKEFMEVLKNV